MGLQIFWLLSKSCHCCSFGSLVAKIPDNGHPMFMLQHLIPSKASKWQILATFCSKHPIDGVSCFDQQYFQVCHNHKFSSWLITSQYFLVESLDNILYIIYYIQYMYILYTIYVYIIYYIQYMYIFFFVLYMIYI